MLTLGVVGRSRKPDERRLPIHPAHFERIEEDLRRAIFLEHGYGERFGVTDAALEPLVGGLRTREELAQECDVIVLPKPLAEDLTDIPEGKILWGWPHVVQDEAMTQLAIDRRLTLIAWEAMNHWTSDGGFGVHVFHKNNELAGYCSVLHAMQLLGITGTYGPPRSAAVLSFGATARGAVTALSALGVHDVTVLTQRDPASVASPIHTVKMVNYERQGARAITLRSPDPEEFVQNLGRFDIVVNCVFQDTDDPVVFVMEDELDRFKPGNLMVVGGPADVTVQMATYEPDHSSGWHAHTGMHAVMVLSGTVTFYDGDCQRRTYGPGDTYVGGQDVHLARNETAAPVELAVTYMFPAGVDHTRFHVPSPAPVGCRAG